MGYNALPTLPNADPKIEEEDVRIEVWMATQLSGLTNARDASLTPYVRVLVPFRGFATLELDAVPVELWRVSPETQSRNGAARERGTALGDVRFGGRFLLAEEGRIHPAFGLRLMTKTASGKSLEDRRFTDSPGYMLDGLFGKTLPFALGPFEGVRLLAKVGFMAWQQGSGWQDDAVALGTTLKLDTRRGRRVELEWRTYHGYEQHDRPALIGVTFGQAFGRGLEVAGTLNRSVSADAPPWELRVGLGMKIEHDRGGERDAR